jgi:hypothetical protein
VRRFGGIFKVDSFCWISCRSFVIFFYRVFFLL